MFRPLSDVEKIIIRNKYSEGKPYFLFIGSIHKRKNIVNLLKAFDRFRSKSSTEFKLILAGTKRWWTKEMETAFSSMTFKSDVIFTGRIPDEELYGLTASAFALTYVSLFEGFGIPIVEAFRCAVPVICSNTTSMPEISGEAALLVNPLSVEEISNAMLELYGNEDLRKSLIEKGLKQKNLFNWDKTAEDLWQCMMKAAKS